MKSNQTNSYLNNHYRQYLTLPPQIPIPYNQSHLHLLSLKLINIDYIDANFPNFKKQTHKLEPQQKQDPEINQFKLRTFWWGEQSGYQSLLKTLTISESKRNSQTQKKPKQLPVKSDTKDKDKKVYEPIRFLVCCPLDNFLKYCLDMRVLKIELISAEMNTIIAKSYINFLTLNNCWKGEPIKLNIPLFASSFNLQSFNGVPGGKQPKIIGEMTLEMALEKIVNPYKMIPQKPNQAMKADVNNSQGKQDESKFQPLNNVNNRFNENQARVSQSVSIDSLNEGEEYLLEEDTVNQPPKSQHIISYHNFDDNANNRRYRKATTRESEPKQKQREVSFFIQNPEYRKIQIPKHNYSAEKIQLQQDFNIVFGVKNPLYQSFFPSDKQQKTPSVQTIEFNVRVVQKVDEKGINNLSFERVTVLIPVIQNIRGVTGQKPKLNQYKICQKEGIIKMQFDSASFSAKQIEKFIKETMVEIEIVYSQSTQIEAGKRGVNSRLQNTKQREENFVLRGSISMLALLASCGVENRINLVGDKKVHGICHCFIVAVGKKSQQNQIAPGSPKINDSSQKQAKKPIQNSFKGKEQELVWIRIEKFIPLNHNYLRDSNIFVKINLIIVNTNFNTNHDPSLEDQSQKIKIKQIAETSTLWKPFAEINQLIANFKNQLITFPISASQNEQCFIKLQIWNKQKKNIKIGEALFATKEKSDGKNQRDPRGRREVEIKDLKNQMIGFLEIWYEKGNINYINNLIGVHIGAKQNQKKNGEKNHNKKERQPQRKQVEGIEKGKHEKRDLDVSEGVDSSSDWIEGQSQQSQSLEQSGHQNNQKKFKENQYGKQLDQQIQQRYKEFSDMEQKLNELNGNLLEIHNLLFYALFVVINRSEIKTNLFDLLQRNQGVQIDGNIYLTPKQFYSLLVRIISNFIGSDLKSNQNNSLQKFLQIHPPSEQKWFNLFTGFYSGIQVNGSSQMLNFTQFESSFEAYQTYYEQIIESKDNAFKRFKDILQSDSIQTEEIQEDLLYEFQKINEKLSDKQPIQFIKKTKHKIIERILRSSTIKQFSNLQTQTVIENFLSYYHQRAFNLSSKMSSIVLVQQICDEVRKYELYDSTFMTFVESQSFRSFISKSIRNLLDIDFYIKGKDLMNLVEENQIELSRWEMINLTETGDNKFNEIQKGKLQKNSSQKIIVKSPTFGLLQHVNHNENLNEKLFKTSPLEYNPSFVKKMRKNPQSNKILEISSVGSNEEKRESQKSEILKKRIEMISPISNNMDINHELSSAINPSSIYFTNNYNSNNPNRNPSNYLKNPSNYVSNPSELMKKSQNNQFIEANNQQLSTDCLTVLLVDLRTKINWLRLGKNTYYPQQPSFDMSKLVDNDHSKFQQQKENTLSDNNRFKPSQSFQSMNIKPKQESFQAKQRLSLGIQSQKPYQSTLSPAMINLFGLQPQNDYNLLIGVTHKTDSEEQEILMNCEHGLWEKLVDSTGNQIGSIMVCLQSQIHSLSHNLSNNRA